MSIRHAIEDVKSEALEKFVAELMSELLRQGFSLAEVLDALATWTTGRMPESVTYRLEELAKSVKEVGR